MKGPPAREPRFATLGAMMESAAGTRWGLTFMDVHEREVQLPFAELLERARRVAGGLCELGISPGDRVALVLPTGPEFMDAFFGILLAAAVPVPLYPPVRLGRLDEYHRATARMLALTGARLVLTDRRVRLLLGRSIEDARPELKVERVGELREAGAPAPSRDIRPDALGLIQFSSGSTVDPKPVALTHRALLSQCAALGALMPERAEEGGLGVSWLPLYHDMGLIGCLLSALHYPGPLVLIPPEAFLARPALWLRAISRHRGTISAAPNFAYALCVKRIPDSELEGVDLSSWRYALNGSEAVSISVMDRFAERFSRFGFDPSARMPVYGLSEAALAVTFASRGPSLKHVPLDPVALAVRGEIVGGERRVPSVGAPVPGVEVEIRSGEGRVLPESSVGRIYVRGPSLMQGYFGLQEASERALPGGWLNTGDLGFIVDGELHICGRAKDIIVIRGANHPPQHFEEALGGIEGLRAGCAVALGFSPDDGEGEALLILAEVAGPVPPEEVERELCERIRTAVLARTQIKPHTIGLLEPGTLPRTSSGKMRRGEALRRFLAGELAPPRKVTALTMAAEMAKSALALSRAKRMS